MSLTKFNLIFPTLRGATVVTLCSWPSPFTIRNHIIYCVCFKDDAVSPYVESCSLVTTKFSYPVTAESVNRKIIFLTKIIAALLISSTLVSYYINYIICLFSWVLNYCYYVKLVWQLFSFSGRGRPQLPLSCIFFSHEQARV